MRRPQRPQAVGPGRARLQPRGLSGCGPPGAPSSLRSPRRPPPRPGPSALGEAAAEPGSARGARGGDPGGEAGGAEKSGAGGPGRRAEARAHRGARPEPSRPGRRGVPSAAADAPGRPLLPFLAPSLAAFLKGPQEMDRLPQVLSHFFRSNPEALLDVCMPSCAQLTL
ncbi:hypothetical protein EI555_010905, partial [Monodon monoceros]